MNEKADYSEYINLQVLLDQLSELFDHENIKVFIPDLSFGHITTNAAIILSKIHAISIKEAFDKVQNIILNRITYIDRVELVSGFCNLWLKSEYLVHTVQIIGHRDGHSFGYKDIGKKKKVNIEYISANPTGPMHLGHLRGLYADALANLLEFFNYDVTREFYINDTGNQIKILGESLKYQYCVLHKISYPKPSELYPGKEISQIANLLDADLDIKNNRFFEQKALSQMMQLIKDDLNNLNVHFDKWTSELSLHGKGVIEAAITYLENKGCIKYGILGEIIGDKGEASNKEIKIFNEQKAVTKADGTYTYFGGDLGYLYDKINRNFDILIYCVGSDQGNHFNFLQKACKIINPSCEMQIISFQSVDMIKNGQNFKFSKRGGISIRPSELNLPNLDILRLMMLSKSNNTHFSINLDEMQNESMSNPFYYIQYAFARAKSILNNQYIDGEKPVCINHYTASMRELIYLLAQYPVEIKLGLNAINIITNYVEKIATKFHSIWNEGLNNKDERWIIRCLDVTNSRLQLIKAFKIVMQSALKILSIRVVDIND